MLKRMKNCHILTDNKLLLNSTANFKRYTSIMIKYAQFGCVLPYTQMAGADETRCHISPAIAKTRCHNSIVITVALRPP